MLLVVCEDCLKAPKILKYVDALGLDGWEWLNPSLKVQLRNVGETKHQIHFRCFAGRPIFSFLWKQEVSDYAMVGQGWRDWLRLHYTLLP